MEAARRPVAAELPHLLEPLRLPLCPTAHVLKSRECCRSGSGGRILSELKKAGNGSLLTCAGAARVLIAIYSDGSGCRKVVERASDS